MKLKISTAEANRLLSLGFNNSLKEKGLPGAMEVEVQPDNPPLQSGLNNDLIIYFQAICQTDTEEQAVWKLETILDINKDSIENLLVADQDDVIRWYLNYYSLKDYKNVS